MQPAFLADPADLFRILAIVEHHRLHHDARRGRFEDRDHARLEGQQRVAVGHRAFGEDGDRPVVGQRFLERIDLFGHAQPVLALDEDRAVEAAQPADDGHFGEFLLGDEGGAAGAGHAEDVDPADVVRNEEHVAPQGRADDLDPRPDDARRATQEQHREGRAVGKDAVEIVERHEDEQQYEDAEETHDETHPAKQSQRYF